MPMKAALSRSCNSHNVLQALTVQILLQCTTNTIQYGQYNAMLLVPAWKGKQSTQEVTYAMMRWFPYPYTKQADKPTEQDCTCQKALTQGISRPGSKFKLNSALKQLESSGLNFGRKVGLTSAMQMTKLPLWS